MHNYKKTAASLLGASLIYVFDAAAAPARQPPQPGPVIAQDAGQSPSRPEAAHDVERDPMTGKKIAEYYLLGIVPHRMDGPAIIKYDPQTEQVLSEEYWRSSDGDSARPHRDGDDPATIEYDYSSGKKIIVMETWWHNGYPDRPIGPQTVERDEMTGNIVVEEYWHHGKCDRSDGPAKLEYDPAKGKAGPPIKEIYYHANDLDRSDGPAFILRDPQTLRVVAEHYWRHNRRHREDGPAIVERDPQTGQITRSEYWIKGRKVEALTVPAPGT